MTGSCTILEGVRSLYLQDDQALRFRVLHPPQSPPVLPNPVQAEDQYMSEQIMFKTHTHTLLHLSLRTFTNTMQSLAPYPNPTHLN